MSRRTVGILASLVGSALGAWWFAARRRSTPATAGAYDRGTVIFDNTPTAPEVPDIF